MGKISVLMAVYNSEQYLEEAINSVIAQSYEDWEFIIVDDASSDKSIETIRPFLKNGKIKLIKHEIKRGYGASCLTAINNSQGKVVGILDSDDVLHKNALEIMNKYHEEDPDCGLIYSSFYKCDKNLNIMEIPSWVGVLEKGKTNLHEPRISHFKTFKRRDYLKTEGFNPDLRSAVDKDLIFKLEEVTKLKFIDLPLYYWRKNSRGISQDNQEKEALINYTLVMFRAYKRRLKNNYPNLSAREMSKRLLKILPDCIELKKWNNFFFLAINGVYIRPVNAVFLFSVFLRKDLYFKIVDKFS